MASSTIMNVQPENSDSSQSALELLKPDPPLEHKPDEPDEAEDDLEALRMAALASIRPKKSAYKVQAHPVRSNLLSIVPVEEEKPKPKLAVILPRNSTMNKESSPGKNSKFNRYDSDKSSIESDSEEEIEVEEEVTATESESEEKETNEKDGEKDATKAKTETSGDGIKKQISVEPDDVLKIDCTDEVDEFTNFLNEFEDELKSPMTDGPKKPVVAAANKGPKPKKTKIILVKKKVKKVKNQSSRAPASRPRPPGGSRSPRGQRKKWTPPPRGGRYSPVYRRSPSPYRRRRYSRSPSPRGRYRPRSRSPRSYRHRSPPRRPARRSSRSPLSPQRRGGSAPRHLNRSRSGSKDRSPNNTGKEDQKQDKSKSLPPASGIDSQNGKKSGKLSKEEKAAMEAEEKFKKLPTPEREKILQRRKKFEGNMPVKPVAKKISLKRAAADPDDNPDDNDTEDKSEKEKSMPPAKNRRQANKASNEPQAKVVTDLRVHLHKKSRLQQNTTAVPVPVAESPEPEVQFESDVDSLENARVTSSDEEEFVQTQKKIPTSGTGSNRFVTKSINKGSPKKVGFDQDSILPTKRNMLVQRSVMSRLGAKVISDGESEEEVVKIKRKIKKSSEEEEDLDLNPQPLLAESKREKKEKKKKEKKKKKDKKKEKKKSKKQQRSSSSDEEHDSNPPPQENKATAPNSDNSEDEELMSFFENLDSEDILLEKMKKKNDKLTARHKKVEEDRKLHS